MLLSWVCICWGTCMLQCTYGGQTVTCRTPASPRIIWVLRVDLRTSDSVVLSHLWPKFYFVKRQSPATMLASNLWVSCSPSCVLGLQGHSTTLQTVVFLMESSFYILVIQTNMDKWKGIWEICLQLINELKWPDKTGVALGIVHLWVRSFGESCMFLILHLFELFRFFLQTEYCCVICYSKFAMEGAYAGLEVILLPQPPKWWNYTLTPRCRPQDFLS